MICGGLCSMWPVQGSILLESKKHDILASDLQIFAK
jgi:hypothetical protein